MPGIQDFESRLHQLAIDEPSLDTLVIEGDGYWNDITVHEQDKWEREARKRRWLFTGNVYYLQVQVFNIGLPGTDYILGENSEYLYDELGNNLEEEG